MLKVAFNPADVLSIHRAVKDELRPHRPEHRGKLLPQVAAIGIGDHPQFLHRGLPSRHCQRPTVFQQNEILGHSQIALTVKVCGVPCGPNTNDPAGARTAWPPTQTISSPSRT
jgi:hypothetical protein